MIYGPVWIWYVMVDQVKPTEYWRGRIMYFNGTRDLGEEAVRRASLSSSEGTSLQTCGVTLQTSHRTGRPVFGEPRKYDHVFWMQLVKRHM